MSAPLRLRVRTPLGLLVDGPVAGLRAEDLDGWFGVLPGRADLVAVLPPGLIVFRDRDGDGFVAVSGGLLDLRAGECRVMVREGVLARDLDELAGRLETLLRLRRERRGRSTSVLEQLAREALRRLVAEVRG